MVPDETDDGRSGLGEVHVTILVTRQPRRYSFRSLLAGTRVRVGLALVGLLAAGTAGTLIVASQHPGRSQAAGRSPQIQSPQLAAAVTTRFGIEFHCLRLTVVSPDHTYARVDFDPATPCGTYGNYVTIILHRVHGAWLREFETTGWTCPTSLLPPAVPPALQLCRGTAPPPPRALHPSDHPKGAGFLPTSSHNHPSFRASTFPAAAPKGWSAS
jgi:hypothetical protein